MLRNLTEHLMPTFDTGCYCTYFRWYSLSTESWYPVLLNLLSFELYFLFWIWKKVAFEWPGIKYIQLKWLNSGWSPLLHSKNMKRDLKKKKVLGAIPQTQTFIKNLGLETFKEDKQQSKYTQTEKLVMCVRVKHMCAVSACLHVHLCVINSPLCLWLPSMHLCVIWNETTNTNVDSSSATCRIEALCDSATAEQM